MNDIVGNVGRPGFGKGLQDFGRSHVTLDQIMEIPMFMVLSILTLRRCTRISWSWI